MSTSRRDILRAAVAGGITATVGTVATDAQADPLDALTFYHCDDTGWPHAYSGEALDPVKEWEFRSAICLAGLNKPTMPGTPIRTDRARAA